MTTITLTKAQKIKYLNRLEWFLTDHFDYRYCPLDNFNYAPGERVKLSTFSLLEGVLRMEYCDYCIEIVSVSAPCPCDELSPRTARTRGLAAVKRERKKLGVKS